MPKVTIDGHEVQVEEGVSLLDAARHLGIEIPTLCHLDGCNPEASCQVCLVKLLPAGKFVASCATPASDGMTVESETEEVRTARRTALELLLGDHLGDCDAACETACPAHPRLPQMIRQMVEADPDEASSLISEALILPATLGYICAAFCERACRRGHVDTPVSIRRLHRYLGEERPAGNPQQQRESSGKSVAIVGAGPAGLAAGTVLARLGHEVTFFDDHPEPGGALTHEIPAEALPGEVVTREVAAVLKAAGGQYRQARLGTDIGLDELRGQFDAVLVAVGELAADDIETLGLASGKHGVEVKREDHMTTVDGVFAAGSAVNPSRHGVRAVADGKAAAQSINRFLSEGNPGKGHHNFGVHMGRLEPEALTLFSSTACLPAGDRELTATDGESMTAIARRCLQCQCGAQDDCRLRHWADVYEANAHRYAGPKRDYERVLTHPALVYESGKCISCGLCVQIARRAGEPLGLAFIGRGFSMRLGVPFSESLAEALETAAVNCARACPTGALVLKSEMQTPSSEATNAGREG